MDKKPTAEQLKKFWEWCGFKENIPPKGFSTDYKWVDPFIGVVRRLPDLDLNNLFKYAVPKLMEMRLNLNIYNMPDFNAYEVAIKKQMPLGQRLSVAWISGEPDPAVALFKAIQEVING